MELHELKSIRHAGEPDVYVALVEITDINGERYECEYISRKDDLYGLAPEIRTAIDDWIRNGKEVGEYIPEPPYVPQIISRRQFYQGLATVGKITKAEAIAAIASGTVPPAIRTIIDGLEDEDAQFEATMTLIGATEFDRNHPLVLPFAITQGMSDEDVDQFWILCSEL